jgi:hypothetical protein
MRRSAVSAGARELLQRRLAAQWLAPSGAPPSGADGSAGVAAGAAADAVAAAARHLLATQAQDFGQGVWALGARVPGSTRRDVFAALDGASVVRSWPMRGTLHLIEPDDLRALLSLTARRTVSGAGARHRALGIDEAAVARAGDVARGLLGGGGRATREQFTTALAEAGLQPSGQRGMHLIWLLAHEGLVCWGPLDGDSGQQALVLLDEWAPATREQSPADALDELLLRYIRGHGPTTLKDFCWWTKLLVSDSTAALGRIRDRLEEIDLGLETPFLVEAGAGAGSGSAAGTGAGSGTADAGAESGTGTADDPRRSDAQLALPGFDEYLLGYRSRSPALAPEHSARVVPGENGMFLPMLVSRGRIVGTWKRRIGAKAVTVSPEPFEPLPATEQRGFERALRRYADFLELPATFAPWPSAAAAADE